MTVLFHLETPWQLIQRRLNLTEINPDTEVIPVNGSREALFSFAQAVVDTDMIGRW
jgi:aspartate/methionine/tyrosine aminotransferase